MHIPQIPITTHIHTPHTYTHHTPTCACNDKDIQLGHLNTCRATCIAQQRAITSVSMTIAVSCSGLISTRSALLSILLIMETPRTRTVFSSSCSYINEAHKLSSRYPNCVHPMCTYVIMYGCVHVYITCIHTLYIVYVYIQY